MKKILFLLAFLSALVALAQESKDTTSKNERLKVFTFTIDKEIDPRTNRLCDLALKEALNQNAHLVILKLDTYGGAVVDADSIRKRLLDFPRPIFAYINKNAASAGALISIACDSIYMAPGSNIGAATVVYQGGEAAPDKYQSYMRSMMRSTAETNGRNPKIAEAMVDQSLAVDSISEAGKVITFTTKEALKYDFCDAEVNSVDEILKLNNFDNYEIVEYELPATEAVISVFLNPFISGILILVIVGGIYFELQTPGIGFPLGAAIVAAVLYFVPYYLNGLAANWEIALFLVGLVLIALEVFVIPGFGVAGISGIIITVASLFLVMMNNDLFDFTFVVPSTLGKSAMAILVAGAAGIAFSLFGGLGLIQSKALNRLSLQSTMDADAGYSVKISKEDMKGTIGTVYSDLRTSGKININNKIYDAESRGEYIEKGTSVVVIKEIGSVLLVKKAGDQTT